LFYENIQCNNYILLKKIRIFYFFIIDNYESCIQSVCIMLNGEESELRFINNRELPVNCFFYYYNWHACNYVPPVFVYHLPIFYFIMVWLFQYSFDVFGTFTDKRRPTAKTSRCVSGYIFSGGQKQLRNGRNDFEKPPRKRNVAIETSHIGRKQSRYGPKQRSFNSRYALYSRLAITITDNIFKN